MKICFSISAFVWAMLITCVSFAQDPKHEISLGYGLITTHEIANSFSDAIADGLSGTTTQNTVLSGVFYGSYQYLLKNRFVLGATFGYEHGKADVYNGATNIGVVDRNYYVLAGEADYRYIHKPTFTMYSGIGFGASVFHEKYIPDSGPKTDDQVTYFDFQETLTGFRLGNKIGGFAELGFGYKGFITAGIFGRL